MIQQTSSKSYHIPQESRSFKDLLSGPLAFYADEGYLEVTKKDFLQDKPLAFVSYAVDLEGKVCRAARRGFTVISVAGGAYEALHMCAAKYKLLPSSNPSKKRAEEIKNRRLNIPLDGEWKYKRITIEVNGNKIDAAIVGKPVTLNNGRWILDSNGNNSRCETKLFEDDCDLKNILAEIEANALVFNYPGVGSSEGFPGRRTMVKAYLTMLSFLKDQTIGIGAKEIILYGHSIGAGVQAEALLQDSNGIRVCVKSRSFSDLRSVVSAKTKSYYLGLFVRMLDWNIRSVESSKGLQIPEIIMQTASVESCQELTDSESILDDNVIAKESTLAKALLEDDDKRARKNKVFLAVPEKHNDVLSLGSIKRLTQEMRKHLNLDPSLTSI